jgi:methylmalonyl-CoA/ethylmalonyl-CoA epimerase
MKIKRIEHVAIAVHDMAESMAMLEKTLGLEVEYEERIGPTRLAMYPVGQTYIELLQGEGPDSGAAKWIARNGQSLFHLCFEVEDIDDGLVVLRLKGVKRIVEKPRIGHGGARIAFVDPQSTGDILIELAELPESHAA